MKNSKRFAWLLLLLAGLSGPAPAQAPAVPKPKDKPAAVTPAESIALLTAPIAPATYDQAGRRDPFRNLLRGNDISEKKVITGLSDLTIVEIQIVGVVKSKGRFEAVIGMSSGFPLTAREGDRFSDGYVLSIAEGQVVLRQTHQGGVPLIKPKDIIREITSEER
jgi:hypothetical protein